MRISDWISDVCSSDLPDPRRYHLSQGRCRDGQGLRGAWLRPVYLRGQGQAGADELLADAGRAGGRCRRGGHLGEDRSEEGREGKGWGSTCRSRWEPDDYKKKRTTR